MITVGRIISEMESWTPAACAEDWDNVGLLVGDAAQEVHKVLVALDATEEVINEAIAGGFDFIITHHPLIYNPIKRVNAADSVGRKIIALVRHGIGCFCAHTNLDKAAGGVNDCLAEKIGLTQISALMPETLGVSPQVAWASSSASAERPAPNPRPLFEKSGAKTLTGEPPQSGGSRQSFVGGSGETFSKVSPEKSFPFGIGRVGFLSEGIQLAALSEKIKSALCLDSVRVCGDSEKIVKKIAVCGGDGSGSRYISAAIALECDLYITGDLRYHCVQEALESGIALLDITHYGGEKLIVDAIVSRLKPLVEIFPTSIEGQVFASM